MGLPLRLVAFVLSVLLVACTGVDVIREEPDASNEDAAPPSGCQVDGDCDDGVYCDGEESCGAQHPDADVLTGCVIGQAPIVCDDGIGCTSDHCDEAQRQCSFEVPDQDGDGHGDGTCVDADDTPLGDDCDDRNGSRYPGNTEICVPGTTAAMRDEDCDETTLGDRDLDGDGHTDQRCCNPDSTGRTVCGDDCDDGHITVYPGAGELCDGLDNDCNGRADDLALCGGCDQRCHRNATCVARGVSFDCVCDHGFEGDGVTCKHPPMHGRPPRL